MKTLVLLLMTMLGISAQVLPAFAQPALPSVSGFAPSTSSAQAALDVLKNDAERAKLITVLEGLARGVSQPAPAAARPDLKAAPRLAPDSLGAELINDLTDRLHGVAEQVAQLGHTVADFPLLWSWLVRLITDPALQLVLLSSAWPLALVLGLWIGAELLARHLLRKPLAALRRHAPDVAEPDGDHSGTAAAEAGQTEWTRRRGSAVITARRLPGVLASAAVMLLPLLAVATIGMVAAASGLAGTLTARRVILTALYAYLSWRLVGVLAESLMQPGEPKLRLLPISNKAARETVRQASRLAAVAAGGWAVANISLLFGLSELGHDALAKLTALLVYGLVAGIVLRNRAEMDAVLRAPEELTGPMARVRDAVAGVWHRIVLLYLLALWMVWALGIPNGFSRLLRMVIWAVLVVFVARMISLLLMAGLDRLLRYFTELDATYPGLGKRMEAYHPISRALVSSIVSIAAVILLLQAWGLDSFSWLPRGQLGGRTLAALGSITATLILAVAVWELTNAAIDKHLARLARESQLSRSARLRTLLPMLRTTLLICVCLIAGLVILSEIGVNIAPLLAGAGVIGLAIGFGSQKLVQDIITGLFLLLENAMQVGDVVSLGGMSGTVENLSIRTIRLRALDGAVHIVPFSAVTTVTNMTRDFGFAVIDVSVGLNEEPDHIAQVLREIAADLQLEKDWRGVILADLDVMGVERFTDLAYVLRVRIKTLPASRWAVGRELNRRIKMRFDVLAIESPMTSYRALGMAPPIAGLTP